MEPIIKKALLPFPVSKVWKAISDAQQFGEWFRVKLKSPFISGQNAVGHITYPGYEHLEWKARIQKIQPEKLFSFTWHPYAVDPKTDYSNEIPTLVEFKLVSQNGGTELTITESGFENVPAHRREEAWKMNDGGWTEQMKNIREYLSSK